MATFEFGPGVVMAFEEESDGESGITIVYVDGGTTWFQADDPQEFLSHFKVRKHFRTAKGFIH